jgi:hypothetical protein
MMGGKIGYNLDHEGIIYCTMKRKATIKKTTTKKTGRIGKGPKPRIVHLI